MGAFLQSGLTAQNHKSESSEERLSELEQAVQELRAGSPFALASLDKLLVDGVRWMLKRKLRRDHVEDLVPYILMLVAEAVRSGCVTSAAEVPRFLRTAVSSVVQDDNNPPEDLSSGNQNSVHLIQGMLERLPERERKALSLYYSGLGLERTCEELGFSTAEFAILRSRTKARYLELQAKAPEKTLRKLAGLFHLRVA